MSRHEELAEGAGLREEGGVDAVTGRVLAELVSRSHLMEPDEVSTALTQAALPLGVLAACIYLADLHYQVWIPLVDGTARPGVLCLTVADVSEAMLDRYRALASLAGLMIEAKVSYSDTYAQTQRSREMALQAELVWAFLPPSTFATERVLVSASLEPAYEAGGDAFDYSLLGDHLTCPFLTH
jgi:hypothetical protein